MWSTSLRRHGARLERRDRRLLVRRALRQRVVAVAAGVQDLQRDRAARVVDGAGDPLVPLRVEAVGHLGGERLEPAALGRRVAAGDDQADTPARPLLEERRELVDVPRVVLEPGVHRAHDDAVAERQRVRPGAEGDRLEQVGVEGVRHVSPLRVGVQVVGDPVDPEAFEADAAAQHQPLVEPGPVEGGRVGELLALELLVVREPGGVVGPGVQEVGGQRGAVAVRRPAQLDRQLAAERLHRHRRGQPLGQHPPPLGRRRVDPLVGPALLLDDLDAHPAVGLHPRQHAVDLLVGGVPEEAERLLEPPGQLEPARRALAERDEEGVLEGHAGHGA